MSDAWKKKADKVIFDLCMAEYDREKAKMKGKKKRVRYTVPEVAEDLVDCMYKDDEERAKAIMLEYNDKIYEDSIKEK